MTEHDELTTRLAALEERVAQLEQPATTKVDPGRFWALTGLRERLADSDGQVLFTGATNLPTGEYYEWQQGAHTDQLLDADWTELATPFAALGHPVRMMLLQHILRGTRTVGELQELAGLGTTGQLYHHLKQLVAAGWLHAAGRGHYSVPGARVVPLLVVLSAVAPPSTKDNRG
ncbi:ArsR family transcriptional regulator [Pseudonocardiaceae bacterium YIM PH 21723]|nr:ArsR family transcriptional regulator [Pseudonocardiaceae bacterium YIM PH 21723]